MRGSHWISLAFNGTKIDVYDSFGRPARDILPLAKKDVINSDLDSEQGDLENNCGPRSIAWLYIYNQFGRDIALII